MSRPTYAEMLKDPRWQRKRLEILERDGWTCQNCSSTTVTLHVHHKVYESGKSPWEYNNSVYVTYCDSCHEKAAKAANLLVLAAYDHAENKIAGLDAIVIDMSPRADVNKPSNQPSNRPATTHETELAGILLAFPDFVSWAISETLHLKITHPEIKLVIGCLCAELANGGKPGIESLRVDLQHHVSGERLISIACGLREDGMRHSNPQWAFAAILDRFRQLERSKSIASLAAKIEAETDVDKKIELLGLLGKS